ncbi:hypothetical protein LR48_Vigan04g181800 [Vigna angularis]|uniref:Uncharacterized protein n=1 Tax=Phaseolus angularis TaxID=3914 RepID=A0A0L9UFE4_PHAAN|nr:hypothetical protein LR48_Vigan04g181800 [Vigna angularis]
MHSGYQGEEQHTAKEKKERIIFLLTPSLLVVIHVSARLVLILHLCKGLSVPQERGALTTTGILHFAHSQDHHHPCISILNTTTNTKAPPPILTLSSPSSVCIRHHSHILFTTNTQKPIPSPNRTPPPTSIIFTFVRSPDFHFISPNTRNRSKPLLFSLPIPHLQQHALAITSGRKGKLNPVKKRRQKQKKEGFIFS